MDQALGVVVIYRGRINIREHFGLTCFDINLTETHHTFFFATFKLTTLELTGFGSTRWRWWWWQCFLFLISVQGGDNSYKHWQFRILSNCTTTNAFTLTSYLFLMIIDYKKHYMGTCYDQRPGCNKGKLGVDSTLFSSLIWEEHI